MQYGRKSFTDVTIRFSTRVIGELKRLPSSNNMEYIVKWLKERQIYTGNLGCRKPRIQVGEPVITCGSDSKLSFLTSCSSRNIAISNSTIFVGHDW